MITDRIGKSHRYRPSDHDVEEGGDRAERDGERVAPNAAVLQCRSPTRGALDEPPTPLTAPSMILVSTTRSRQAREARPGPSTSLAMPCVVVVGVAEHGCDRRRASRRADRGSARVEALLVERVGERMPPSAMANVSISSARPPMKSRDGPRERRGTTTRASRRSNSMLVERQVHDPADRGEHREHHDREHHDRRRLVRWVPAVRRLDRVAVGHRRRRDRCRRRRRSSRRWRRRLALERLPRIRCRRPRSARCRRT